MYQRLTADGPRTLLKYLPLILILLGLIERITWLAIRIDFGHGGGEAENVAIAFSRTGTISDVFAKGSGLTAHLNPLLPWIAGTLYQVFGVQAFPAELILATVSIGLAMGSFVLYYRAFGLMDAHPAARLIGLAACCLLPLNEELETITFRVWEGALVAALSAANLCLLLQAEAEGNTGTRRFALMAALAAFILFINPAMGLTQLVLLGLWTVRNLPRRRWIGAGVTAAIALVAVLTPWTIRNYEAFGRFVPLRSNAGLELALANHPAAAASRDDDSDLQVFVDRLHQIHPQESMGAFLAMERSGGEIDYANRLGAQARGWIFTHPMAFLQLSLKHAKQFYFPPAWQWLIYGTSSRATSLKVAEFAIISMLGLLGAFACLIGKQGRSIYAAVIVLVPSLPYFVTQPVPRYRYIVYAPLVYLASEVIVAANAALFTYRMKAAAGASAPSPSPAPTPAAQPARVGATRTFSTAEPG